MKKRRKKIQNGRIFHLMTSNDWFWLVLAVHHIHLELSFRLFEKISKLHWIFTAFFQILWEVTESLEMIKNLEKKNWYIIIIQKLQHFFLLQNIKILHLLDWKTIYLLQLGLKTFTTLFPYCNNLPKRNVELLELYNESVFQ